MRARSSRARLYAGVSGIEAESEYGPGVWAPVLRRGGERRQDEPDEDSEDFCASLESGVVMMVAMVTVVTAFPCREH